MISRLILFIGFFCCCFFTFFTHLFLSLFINIAVVCFNQMTGHETVFFHSLLLFCPRCPFIANASTTFKPLSDILYLIKEKLCQWVCIYHIKKILLGRLYFHALLMKNVPFMFLSLCEKVFLCFQ